MKFRSSLIIFIAIRGYQDYEERTVVNCTKLGSLKINVHDQKVMSQCKVQKQHQNIERKCIKRLFTIGVFPRL